MESVPPRWIDRAWRVFARGARRTWNEKKKKKKGKSDVKVAGEPAVFCHQRRRRCFRPFDEHSRRELEHGKDNESR